MSDYLLLRADSRRIPLPDQSVHCVVTSPPYFGLRSYLKDDDRFKDREIGLEDTPASYIAAMVQVFREVRRVLRDDGCLWLNIGDGYGSGNSGLMARDHSGGFANGRNTRTQGYTKANPGRRHNPHGTIRGMEKQLLGIPWALAFALRDDGWYLRADAPWPKRSPMPSSVTDRPGLAHEHVFLLTKKPHYFYDHIAVQRAAASATVARDAYTRITSGKDGDYAVQHDHETPSNGVRNHRTTDFFRDALDELIDEQAEYLAHLRKIRDRGGLLTDEAGEPLAFHVAATAFAGAHYAVMPQSIIKPCILASTSQAGCCPQCGKCWDRIVQKSVNGYKKECPKDRSASLERKRNYCDSTTLHGQYLDIKKQTIGWQPTCRCDAGPPRPCVVFDPFSGAGSVPMTALQLGRHGIGTELSAEYLDLARRRIERPASIRPVRRREDEGMSLFRDLADEEEA